MFAHDSLLQGRPQENCGLGAVLQRRGGVPVQVVFIDRGVVGLGVAGAQGLEHCLGLVHGPCWLEPGAAVLGLASAVDAVAQSPVVLRRVALADFERALRACSAEVRTMVVDMARLHQQQTEVAVSRLVQDAEGRCAQWLLKHARAREGGPFVVEFHDRKRQVAQLLGIAPETLSRIFKLLRERGLIAGSGRIVELVDMHALTQLAGA